MLQDLRYGARMLLKQKVWVPKMPSESFSPEFHQIDEFNFDSAFVNSDNSASHSLGQRILPGRVGGGDHFFDPHSSCPPLKIMSIDRIPVSDQKAWGGVFRKRLDQLLGSPGGGWMLRNVEMNDLTPLV